MLVDSLDRDFEVSRVLGLCTSVLEDPRICQGGRRDIVCRCRFGRSFERWGVSWVCFQVRKGGLNTYVNVPDLRKRPARRLRGSTALAMVRRDDWHFRAWRVSSSSPMPRLVSQR